MSNDRMRLFESEISSIVASEIKRIMSESKEVNDISYALSDIILDSSREALLAFSRSSEFKKITKKTNKKDLQKIFKNLLNDEDFQKELTKIFLATIK